MAVQRFLPRDDFHQFFILLQAQFERVIGPKVDNGAVSYAEITHSAQFPIGYSDEAAPGYYRLKQSGAARLFDCVTSAQGLKPWLFPPEEPLWRVSCDGAAFTSCQTAIPKTAVIGVRACDLAGVDLLDRHFSQGQVVDPRYQERRRSIFIIAVSCHRCVDTCFCVSTGDGPQITQGYDLVLDELDDGFVIDVGTQAGDSLLTQLYLSIATPEQLDLIKAARQGATQQLRRLPRQVPLSQLIAFSDMDSPWQQVAQRCLSCGNCTAVCPSCFCFHCLDEAPPGADSFEHTRQWDSCFSDQHSYIVGHVVRQKTAQKYRQWFMHKLVYWHSQYERSGCSGCGRCMTWCPAAIDLTREAELLCQKLEGDPDD